MKNLDAILDEIGRICKEKRYSIVTAESCTGGGIAFYITKHPHCSSIFERGYITYSISSKENVLGVSSYNLQTYGAVSKEITIEMAEKALEKSKAQISVAITGIDQEVIAEEGLDKSGIAWISCAGIGKRTLTKQFNIEENREKFCERVILSALSMLLDFLK